MKIPRWKNWPHVLRMQQFSAQDLQRIIRHASRFEDAIVAEAPLPRLSRRKRKPARGAKRVKNGWRRERRVRLLFFETSTRTEGTFLDALAELGCSQHAVKEPKNFSSAMKGESPAYAIAAYGCAGDVRGCDGIVMRHEDEGACQRAADVVDTILQGRGSKRPFFIINAGDGTGQHPTQALVDLATIYRHRLNSTDFLNDITVLFPGELDKSRVVNSLLYAFGRFADHGCRIKVLFCCPQAAGPKEDLLMYLGRHQVSYEFVEEADFPQAVRAANVVYMTRVQRERRQAGKTVRVNREAFVFQESYLKLLKPGAFVMHPLPINEDPDDPPPEIDPKLTTLALTGDPRCAWLGQSHRGLAVRAALLDLIFAGTDQGWKP